MQLGARFNDTRENIFVDHFSVIEADKVYTFRGMLDNPWWHGHFKTNYVAAYVYITKLANQMQYGGTINAPKGLSVKAKNGIDTDMAELKKYWREVLAMGTVSGKAKRDFTWGMATHTLADTFAHSAFIWNKTDRKWIHLVHKKENAYHKDEKYAVADDITKYPERWNNARNAVDESVRQYEKSGHPAGTCNEFRYVNESDSYRFGKIYDFVRDVAGASAASKFQNSSCSTK